MNSDCQLLSGKLLDEEIKGKILKSFGTTSVDNKDCELFLSELDEVETCFESKISVTAGQETNGVSPAFLKKIWRISDEQAANALKQNTKLNRQSSEGELSQQFSTNDKMICYRQINSCFFTDIFLSLSQQLQLILEEHICQ